VTDGVFLFPSCSASVALHSFSPLPCWEYAFYLNPNILAGRAAQWRRLKALVLNSVSTAIAPNRVKQ
jgi:hypothetical protein